VRAIIIDLAMRSGRFDDVSAQLAAWADDNAGDAIAARDRQLASALVAEASGDRDQARAAYRAALAADPRCEAALRAVADLDTQADVASLLVAMADALGASERGAIARLEALVRDDRLEDAARLEILERLHKAAPTLPFAAFLAERIARRQGNVEQVLAWVRERRQATDDPIEAALDCVREALLIVDGDSEGAGTLLAHAHQARPEDVALRDLYERVASVGHDARAAWREERANAAEGSAKANFFLEAAHEYEAALDADGFLRTARAAHECQPDGLARLAAERAELARGETARVTEELLALARATENPRDKRETYERLADLDASKDPSAALLWHRTILENDPLYKRSLRKVEQALVEGGR
jgi:hypothetical protein